MNQGNLPPEQRRWPIWTTVIVVVLFVCAWLLLRRGPETIETVYGYRRGLPSKSVNGTSVLAEMFEEAGHQVSSWRYLSPKLEAADTIVWFPDRMEHPREEVREWLENWLAWDDARTLIYVGRDYDAGPQYWQTILPSAPPEQKAEIQKRLREAKTEYLIRRGAAMGPQETSDLDWFTLKKKGNRRSVNKLSGPWSQGVDAAKVDIELGRNLDPPDWADVLLESKDDVLASRQQWDELYDSQLILVTNGSFLLNLPLINHEHRKLAGKLIDEVGTPGKVVFLETGEDPPKILDEDPQTKVPTGMEVFFIWPLNYVLLHLAVVGVLFAVARWPIFGRPRHTPGQPVSDFGRHVWALAEMLRRTKDEGYAIARLRHYQQAVRKDADAIEPPQTNDKRPLDSRS